MPQRRYQIYDVFTDRALAGNPLAVVHDGEGLSSATMQAIAAEFNLSETVFVAPPSNPVHAATIRIFTPRSELPFAGHPTVGTAIALFERDGMAERTDGAAIMFERDGMAERTDGAAIMVLEEKIGPVRCAVTRSAGGPVFAEFDLPRLPEPVALSAEPELIAAALGLSPADIGFENHKPAAWTAGVPFVTVPVSGLGAAGRVRLDASAWIDVAPPFDSIVASAYVYCRETVAHAFGFHARMFAPHDGIPEDPATGSAAAAFAGQIMRFDEPRDGPCRVWIEQGLEMGRPSAIRLEIDVANRRIEAARIGGHAVRVAAGTLFV